MRVIIAGSRNFKDYEFLKNACDLIFKNGMPNEIVSGGQITTDADTGELFGVDHFGEVYAVENNIPIRRFLPDWEKYHLAAGPIRNTEMAKYATHLIAFWDGQSKGTANMIANAHRFNLGVRIIKFNA